MNAPSLSQKYATAVFSLAVENWLNVLNQVNDSLAKAGSLAKKLQDSSQPFKARQAALDKIIPPQTSQDIRNFLYTMLKDDDLELLSDVITHIERMARGGPQVEVAQITTAIALPDEDKEKFRQRLRKQYGESLEFIFNVDSKIIGGAIIQIGDKMIDGSVATRLESISNKLGVKV